MASRKKKKERIELKYFNNKKVNTKQMQWNERMKKATCFFTTIKDFFIKPCLFQIEGIDPV